MDGRTDENRFSNSKKIYYNDLLSLHQSQIFVTVLLLTELELGAPLVGILLGSVSDADHAQGHSLYTPS